MASGALTHPGLVRENNEDAFLTDLNRGLFIVADGMGGHQAGEVASRIAVETVDRFLSLPLPADVHPVEHLRQAIFAAHDAVRAATREDLSRRGMGTTLLVALLPPDTSTLYLSHVGDSRAYLLRGGSIEQLTENHTLLRQAQLAGVPLPSREDGCPLHHTLSQAVGRSDLLAPSGQEVHVQAGDRLLLCTDGLTDLLTDEEILDLAAPPSLIQEACQALIEAANRRGGRDNITVVLVEIEGDQ